MTDDDSVYHDGSRKRCSRCFLNDEIDSKGDSWANYRGAFGYAFLCQGCYEQMMVNTVGSEGGLDA